MWSVNNNISYYLHLTNEPIKLVFCQRRMEMLASDQHSSLVQSRRKQSVVNITPGCPWSGMTARKKDRNSQNFIFFACCKWAQ
jgi:hypothetical protein